jgi:hypothetical protein
MRKFGATWIRIFSGRPNSTKLEQAASGNAKPSVTRTRKFYETKQRRLDTWKAVHAPVTCAYAKTTGYI